MPSASNAGGGDSELPEVEIGGLPELGQSPKQGTFGLGEPATIYYEADVRPTAGRAFGPGLTTAVELEAVDAREWQAGFERFRAKGQEREWPCTNSDS